MEESWLTTVARRGRFDELFRRILAREDYQRIANSSASDSTLSCQLAPLLSDAEWEIGSGTRAAGSYWRPAPTPIIPAEAVRLVVNPFTDEVHYEGHLVPLTRLPARILGVLAQSMGRWVSHESLVAEALGEETAEEPYVSKAVYNHVYSIRRAFKALAKAKRLDANRAETIVESSQGLVRLNLLRKEIHIADQN